MPGVSPGPVPSSGSGPWEAKSLPQIIPGLGVEPCAALGFREVIFTRGRSLDSQPSKASQQTLEPRPAIAREGKLRPRGRSGVI